MMTALMLPTAIMFMSIFKYGYYNMFNTIETGFHEMGHFIMFLGAASVRGRETVGYWSGIWPEIGSLLSLSAISLGIGVFGARHFLPLSMFAYVYQGTLLFEVLFGGQFDGDKFALRNTPVWPLVSLIVTALVVAVIAREALCEPVLLANGKPRKGQGGGRGLDGRSGSGRGHVPAGYAVGKQ